VKALILAAGYATRLRPLTDTIPKQLLPVGGRPMVDWILDTIEAAGIDDVHLVTNGRFAPDFERWAVGKNITVHDDGTTSNETRLGAIGNIRFVQERADLDDDLTVIAGDNLFDYALSDFIGYWRTKPGASAVAVCDVGTRDLAQKYGIVELDEDDRIVDFVEKPEDPVSTLAATATYIYSREHALLVETYLAEGNPPDQPGNYIAWLQRRAPVYAYAFAGGWYDIGDPDQLLAADNRLRERAGLALRNTYSLH
jgi:glucose-1-phosphate thymidylyltransferase